MAKNAERKRRRRDRQDTAQIINFGAFHTRDGQPPIKPLNRTQSEYMLALRSSPCTLVLGPAGTGKTWIAATLAADRLRAGEIERIILTRPNVPCGRSLGFFPGNLQAKFAPWTAPLTEAISERMGKAAYEIAVKNSEIDVVPFEVMRGRSWKNAFVILDEAQNATLAELKTFLTRIGEDCTVVVNGDASQCDLLEESGLLAVMRMVERQGLPVPIVEFSIADVVRSGVCAMWVEAFAEANL